MRRPQFSLKALLWLMAVVAAFFAGMQVEFEMLKRQGLWQTIGGDGEPMQRILVPLGTQLTHAKDNG